MYHPIRVSGTLIRKYRQLRGLTGEQLANKIERTYKYLLSVERGEVRPSLELLDRIGEALDINPAIFIVGCKHNEIPPEFYPDIAIDSLPSVKLMVGTTEIEVSRDFVELLVKSLSESSTE